MFFVTPYYFAIFGHSREAETAVENYLKHEKGYTKSLTHVHSLTRPHCVTITSQPTRMMQVIAENWAILSMAVQ